MSRRFAVPLSYTPVAAAALAEKLALYSERAHTELVADFETELKVRVGSGYVVAVNTGTAAIHLALKALGVGEGDRVIVSTFTYVASVTPILYLKAEPVLVDCEPLGWNIDPVLMEEAIIACVKDGRKPKAIIVVHTYGMPAKMKEILAVAQRYEIPVMEDAAEAIGSTYLEQPVGTLGHVGSLSFNNNKILTTYGGGAVLTNKASWAAEVLYWATHARKNLPYYEHEEEGFNYRMGSLNAAMGLVELDILDANVAARRSTFESYRKLLGDGEAGNEISWQEEAEGVCSNRWLTCVVVSHNLTKVRSILDQHNIESRPLWKPMHRQPLFKKSKAFTNNTSDRLFDNGLCLPSSNALTLQTIEMIVALIKQGLA